MRLNMDELYGDNHTLDFPGFPSDDGAIISRTWNDWYDRYEKETKEYVKCMHKAEIADAGSQYEL